jgi:hypothetical protein
MEMVPMSLRKTESKRRFRIERLEERIAPTACCSCGGGSHGGSHKSHGGSHGGSHAGSHHGGCGC